MSKWLELQRSVTVELSNLRSELECVQPLLDKLRLQEPDAIEIRAAAATLHAFYGGVERILVLVAKSYGEPAGAASNWHRDLLAHMSGPGIDRRAMLSAQLREQLSEYLGFRHLFRHAYPMTLRWSRLRPLVEKLTTTVEQFSREVETFLNAEQARGTVDDHEPTAGDDG